MIREVYRYDPGTKGKRRRRRLKKAIQDNSFDEVFQELRDLVEELDGYRSVRVRQDLSFLKDRSERYYTEKDSYSVRPRRELQEVAES